MATEHDIVTRVVNQTLSEVKKEFRKEGKSSRVIETVQTGGLKEFRKKDFPYRHYSWIWELEVWRDNILKNYQNKSLGKEEVRVIFESLFENMYWRVKPDWFFQALSDDMSFYLDELNQYGYQIEKNINREGLYDKVLEDTKPLSRKPLPMFFLIFTPVLIMLIFSFALLV